MGERLQSTNSTMVMAGTSGIAAVVSLPTTTVAFSASAAARQLLQERLVDRGWFNGAVALVLEGFGSGTLLKLMPQRH